MGTTWIRRWTALAASVLVCSGLVAYSPRTSAQQQVMSSYNRESLHQMLKDAYEQVGKHYYDPKYHGLDWNARYKEFDAHINDAHNLGEGFAVIASFLDGLKDSHTFFTPPNRSAHFTSGFHMQMIGNRCFITRIRPKSDAEAKLHPGDEILHYDRYNVNRDDFDSLRYYFWTLAPRPVTQLDLESAAGDKRQVAVNTLVQQKKRIVDLTDTRDVWDVIREEEREDHAVRQQVSELGDVAVWKMPEFFLDSEELDRIMGRVRKHKALVVDLRGNPGGAVSVLEQMLGQFFDHEIKIADQVGRKESKPLKAKPHGHAFDGKVYILIDSDSASAAELFSRVMQLEHRATVIGDRSAGAVMEAQSFLESQGADTKMFYNFSITVNDLIMADGKSLEKAGVTPDEQMLPTPADLAAGRDPVLAHAVELAGGKLDAATAGKMFPVEWVPL